MNPDHPDSVRVVSDLEDDREWRIAVIAYQHDPHDKAADPLHSIAQDIATVARNGSVLVFANSRRVVELLADVLSEMAEESPGSFPLVLAHHGSLSKSVRERAEQAAKDGQRVILIATSSLELGIDIGSFKRVCHVDVPWSIVALRQRMGRSGRKEGQPSILRIYTRDRLPIREVSLTAALYPNLLRAIAMVELLLKGKLEPAEGDKLNLSTLVHQILSSLRQWGAIQAEKLYEFLCMRGLFGKVDQQLFVDVLHSLNEHNLVQQNSEIAIVLGKEGRRLTEEAEFCAAFVTNDEFTVRHNEDTIGLLPASQLPKPGKLILLAARRWRVDSIQPRNKTVDVTPADAGDVPVFLGAVGDIHTIIFKQMQECLRANEVPKYLDPMALRLFDSGRRTARNAGLDQHEILISGSNVTWFPWIGTRGLMTLGLFAEHEKLKFGPDGLCVHFAGLGADRFCAFLRRITSGTVDPVTLAALMPEKRFQKFDCYLNPAILDRANANDRLDVQSVIDAAASALKELGDGRHLGHDIVDALSRTIGEHPDRLASCYG